MGVEGGASWRGFKAERVVRFDDLDMLRRPVMLEGVERGGGGTLKDDADPDHDYGIGRRRRKKKESLYVSAILTVMVPACEGGRYSVSANRKLVCFLEEGDGEGGGTMGHVVDYTSERLLNWEGIALGLCEKDNDRYVEVSEEDMGGKKKDKGQERDTTSQAIFLWPDLRQEKISKNRNRRFRKPNEKGSTRHSSFDSYTLSSWLCLPSYDNNSVCLHSSLHPAVSHASPPSSSNPNNPQQSAVANRHPHFHLTFRINRILIDLDP